MVQFTEERRVPRRRSFTRFSAPLPSGSGSSRDLVLSRHPRPPPGRSSRFEGGEETGSDASGTLTNADGPAVNTQMRRQTPVGNGRGEGSSASTEKFFRTLNRRMSLHFGLPTFADAHS